MLRVEAESFTNPWTREMYAWELQNRNVCHIYVVRTADCPVAAFCAFWLVFDEIHINNVAVLPQFRGHGIGTTLMQHVLDGSAAPRREARHARSARVERARRCACTNVSVSTSPRRASTTTRIPSRTR